MGSRTTWPSLFAALVAAALIAGISANSPAGETKQGVQWRNRTPAFFTTDEAVKVGVTLVNIAAEEQAGKLTYKLVDYYGDVALKGSKNIKIKGGETFDLSLAPKLKRKGFYRAHFTFAGTEKSEMKTTFAVLLPRREPKRLDIASPFGMGVYVFRHHGHEEEAIKLAQAAGIKWTREEFSWTRVEPQQDNFKFGENKSVDSAYRHGIHVMGVLNYSNDWSTSAPKDAKYYRVMAPPKHMEDWNDYVTHVVNRYKSQIKYWEIWNEPNIRPFWNPKPDPKRYVELLKASYETTKKADPDCTILGCSTARVDLKFIEEVFKLGGLKYMDIVSVHPYRYPLSPEDDPPVIRSLVEQLRALRKLIDKYGGGKTIWLTEVGWPTHIGKRGVNEHRQAEYIIRMYLLALSVPTVENIQWYNFTNSGWDGKYNEHNFGIVYNNLRVKPAYVAFSVMSSALQGQKFHRTLDLGAGVHALCFKGKSDRETVVLWSAGKPAKVKLAMQDKKFKVIDIMGNEGTRKTKKGVAELALTGSPVFIPEVRLKLAGK